MEKEDLPIVAEWLSNLDFYGEYNPLMQVSRADLQKSYDNPTSEWKWTWFFIEKKDGSKIGEIGHRPVGKAQGIAYAILPSERKKRARARAIHILVRREMPLLRSYFVHQQTTRESVSTKKHGYTPVEKPAVR
jgi:hypothetical protein